jgi:hypothetical protein
MEAKFLAILRILPLPKLLKKRKSTLMMLTVLKNCLNTSTGKILKGTIGLALRPIRVAAVPVT